MRVKGINGLLQKGLLSRNLKNFTVPKFLTMVVDFSITSIPVFAWGDEGECSLSKKNKASQEGKTEQLAKSNLSNQ